MSALAILSQPRKPSVVQISESRPVHFACNGVSLTFDLDEDVAFSDDEDLLRIIIPDTGMGIPAEAAALLSERFYRVDKARSRADLGLAIARWIAEAHKGSIDLVSIPGKGSKFTVSLPR